MKALAFHEHGAIDKLKYQDVPDPKPGDGDVLVRVKAAALNHLDLFVREGIPGLKLPLPFWTGCDIAGDVVEVGAAVPDVKVGDRVAVNPNSALRPLRVLPEGPAQPVRVVWHPRRAHARRPRRAGEGGWPEGAQAPRPREVRGRRRLRPRQHDGLAHARRRRRGCARVRICSSSAWVAASPPPACRSASSAAPASGSPPPATRSSSAPARSARTSASTTQRTIG